MQQKLFSCSSSIRRNMTLILNSRQVDFISHFKLNSVSCPKQSCLQPTYKTKKREKIYSRGLVSDTSVNLKQLKMVSLWGKPVGLQSDPAASSLLFTAAANVRFKTMRRQMNSLQLQTMTARICHFKLYTDTTLYRLSNIHLNQCTFSLTFQHYVICHIYKCKQKDSIKPPGE